MSNPIIWLMTAIAPLLFHGTLLAHNLTIECSSSGKTVKRCPVEIIGEVKLVEQLSLAICKKGQSWDYDSHGIWVKSGCRARFKLAHVHSKKEKHAKTRTTPPKRVTQYKPRSKPNKNELYCASNYRKHHRCDRIILGKVRLVHELSTHPCRFGSSWGFDRNGVWVDKGCVGVFRILPFPTAVQSLAIRCETHETERKWCPAPFPGDAQLIQQLSLAACAKETSWGYDSKGIWVANGCGAQFKVFFRGNPIRIPNWLLGRFVGRDHEEKRRLSIIIHPYGIRKATINKTNIHAELNGDTLSLNNTSYVIEKVRDGFNAVNTVSGRYHSIHFKRK